MITTHDNRTTVKTTRIHGLKLSQKDAVKLARKKKDHEKNLARIEAQPLKKGVREQQKDALAGKYDTKVKAQIGDAKFAQLDRKKRASYDRRLSKKIGMSPEHIRQFKELRNSKAVDHLKIRKSRLTPTEKSLRLESLNAEYDQKLRGLLTPTQYNKLKADKAKSQKKRAGKKKTS